jgi:regulatory protein
MKKITRLVVQKKNKERVNVYLDGEFAFGLALVEAIHLKVGKELSEADILALQDKDAYQRAYQRALDYLSRRPRSSQEVEVYLNKKNASTIHVQSILSRLIERGLLDDFAFAQFWIENRESFRPRGKRALRYELRQKGVNETIIEQALAQLNIDEVESSYRVALKLLPRLRGLNNKFLFKQKLTSYLSRRGFDWDVCQEVCERLWETIETIE